MTPKGDRDTRPAMTFHFTVEYSKAVLESLVEQGEELLKKVTPFPACPICKMENGHRWEHESKTSFEDFKLHCWGRSLVPALIEGAKAVLERYKLSSGNKGTTQLGEHYLGGIEHTMMDLAQAYAPKMLEAGMTLPEAPE